jgi:hypothetical protein
MNTSNVVRGRFPFGPVSSDEIAAARVALMRLDEELVINSMSGLPVGLPMRLILRAGLMAVIAGRRCAWADSPLLMFGDRKKPDAKRNVDAVFRLSMVAPYKPLFRIGDERRHHHFGQSSSKGATGWAVDPYEALAWIAHNFGPDPDCPEGHL